MSPALIRRSKLLMPEVPARYVRCRPLVPGGELPRVTCLVAGPGYGKSATAAQLAQAAGLPVVWYTMDGSDLDVATFFAYLSAGVQGQVPLFGRATAAALAAGEASPVQVAATFVAELEDALLPGLLLVIEDWHHVGEHAALNAAMAFLVEHLPPAVRLVVTSRGAPAWSLAKLKARGQALGLTAADLALDEAEQAAFWAEATGKPEPPEAIAALSRAVEGWPLGLAMLAGLGTSQAGAATPETLHAVLLEEFVDHQRPEVRGWLQRAALLEHFDAPLLGRIFERPQPDAVLGELEAQAMVVRAAGEGGGLRLHALLRELLLKQALHEHGPETLAQWHRAAGEQLAYTAPELALGHFLAAGDEQGALRVGRLAFPALLAGGRMETLARWLDRFSAQTAALSPLALLWRGRLAERRGDLTEAQTRYEAACARAQALGDEQDRFAALVRLASLAASQGRDAAMAAALDEALPLAEHCRPGDRCDLWLAQALIAERHGSVGAASAYNREVLALPIGDDRDLAHAHGIALLNLAAYAVNRGAAAEAKSWLAELLSLAEREELHGLKAPALLYRGILQLQAGEWDGVAETLAALPGRWEAELSWQDAALAHEVAAGQAMACKEWPRAREHLALAGRLYERVGSEAGLRGVADGHLRLAGKQGLWEEAHRAFAACEPVGEDDFYDLQLRLTYAGVLLLSGAPERASAMLDRLVPHLPEEWAYQRAHARLLQGLASDRPEPLAEAIALITDGGFEALLVEHEALFARYAVALAPLSGGRALIDRVAARFGRSVEAEGPASAGWPAESQLTVRCFGPMEVALGARGLNEWARKKAKVLLAYLVVYPRGLHRVELARALYGDGASAEQSFRPVITALRTLLEPDLAPRAPSKYVLVDDEHVRLAPEAIAYSDLAQFQAARERAERARREGRPDDAAAAGREVLALYRGELLAETFMAAYFEPERERYRREAQHELRHLARHHLDRAEVVLALPALQRLLELDPLSGEDALLLIRAHRAQGADELARFAYWDYRNRLRRGVGDKPDEAFEAAYRALGL